MTIAEAREIAYRRVLNGARAYVLARTNGVACKQCPWMKSSGYVNDSDCAFPECATQLTAAEWFDALESPYRTNDEDLQWEAINTMRFERYRSLMMSAGSPERLQQIMSRWFHSP